MPRIKGVAGPYRLFFYSFDCGERKHVHAQREQMTCKFWLEPAVRLANHEGLGQRDLNAIRKMIESNLDTILEAWSEHCR